MDELELTKRLANATLDDVNRDPDSDLSMLSRQFLRALEREDKAFAAGEKSGAERSAGHIEKLWSYNIKESQEEKWGRLLEAARSISEEV